MTGLFARDVAEQCAKPLAVQAEVHDPGGDVDEVFANFNGAIEERRKAGQTHGQALNQFGANRYVLNPAAAAIVKAPSNAGNCLGGYGR